MKKFLFALFSLTIFSLVLPLEASPCFGVYWLPAVAKNTSDNFIFFEGCVRPLKIKNGKVFFKYSFEVFPGKRKAVFDFPKSQLFDDPRKTEYWQLMIYNAHEYGTLWEAIESCAMTQEFPDVTRKILVDMYRSGVIRKNVRTLTHGDIQTILFRYTDRIHPQTLPSPKDGILI
jgi:hypothetical protein